MKGTIFYFNHLYESFPTIFQFYRSKSSTVGCIIISFLALSPGLTIPELTSEVNNRAASGLAEIGSGSGARPVEQLFSLGGMVELRKICIELLFKQL